MTTMTTALDRSPGIADWLVDDLQTGRVPARRPRVTQSHSRPHVSNDNPFSEAQFRTPKYRPNFPPGSTQSKPPELTANASSPGTTITIATAGWDFIHPPTSTTDTLTQCASSAPSSYPLRTPRTPSGSSTSFPSHRRSPPGRGSTHPKRRRPPLSNSRETVPLHPG